jgi:hypothetical protein
MTGIISDTFLSIQLLKIIKAARELDICLGYLPSTQICPEEQYWGAGSCWSVSCTF